MAPTRINKWVADGAPVANRGQRGRSSEYDVDALRGWLEGRKRERDTDGHLSLEQERAKLTRAQLEKTERENRLRAGALVEADEVIRAGQAYSRALSAKIRALPRRLVQLGVIPREAEAGVVAACREILEDAAHWKSLEQLEQAAASSSAA